MKKVAMAVAVSLIVGVVALNAFAGNLHVRVHGSFGSVSTGTWCYVGYPGAGGYFYYSADSPVFYGYYGQPYCRTYYSYRDYGHSRHYRPSPYRVYHRPLGHNVYVRTAK